jgi:hypothetical protein
MENQSPFLTMQRAEGQIKTLLRSVDIELLETAERQTVAKLRRLAVDTRLDIRDYELSETRDEQVKYATLAKRQLAKLRAAILTASNVFGPADVAQISAELEQIEDWLR